MQARVSTITAATPSTRIIEKAEAMGQLCLPSIWSWMR